MYYIIVENKSHSDAKFTLEVSQDLSKEITDEDEESATPIARDEHFGTIEVKENDDNLALFLIFLVIFMVFVFALFAYSKRYGRNLFSDGFDYVRYALLPQSNSQAAESTGHSAEGPRRSGGPNHELASFSCPLQLSDQKCFRWGWV